MKDHFCPTCEQPYRCPRGEMDCGSPHVYDCPCCYQRRYCHELKALVSTVAASFGDSPGPTGEGDLCYGT